MNFSPLMRQIFVASSPQIAAVSIGGINSFPNILLHQLYTNDSTIEMDIQTATWIGSTHGLAGIPSILLPTLMQLMGRKFGCILSCLFGIIGWIIVYLAQSSVTIIIAEVFHGLSTNSLISVSMLTISEMVEPKYRMVSMTMYGVSQTFGMVLVIIIGQYCHWKTVSIIMCCPMILALMIGSVWPESPAWLAYKGKFDECEVAFKWLRGTSEAAQIELSELISAKKEMLAQYKTKENLGLNKRFLIDLWSILQRRDFYMPCIHMLVMLCLLYWGGMIVILIYTADIVKLATGSESSAAYTAIALYVAHFSLNVLCTFLLKYCKNKTIIISSGIGVSMFLFLASIVSYLQDIGYIVRDSSLCLYSMLGVIVFYSFGAAICCLTMSAELMPVKHRGLGGALYVILICFLHSSSLKLSPYLFLYIRLRGTFLLYAANVTLCTLYIWKFVPETKNWTLQNIEDHYNYGRLVKRCDDSELKMTQK